MRVCETIFAVYLNSLICVREDSNHHINKEDQSAYDEYCVQNSSQNV